MESYKVDIGFITDQYRSAPDRPGVYMGSIWSGMRRPWDPYRIGIGRYTFYMESTWNYIRSTWDPYKTIMDPHRIVVGCALVRHCSVCVQQRSQIESNVGLRCRHPCSRAPLTEGWVGGTRANAASSQTNMTTKNNTFGGVQAEVQKCYFPCDCLQKRCLGKA